MFVLWSIVAFHEAVDRNVYHGAAAVILGEERAGEEMVLKVLNCLRKDGQGLCDGKKVGNSGEVLAR